MLMKMCPCKIIGVTGSEGKTTTTSLIYAILKHAGYNTYLGGNIGTPLFTKLSEMVPEDIVVLELSSFQLMEMEVSPHISVITNITPNHLNIHSSYEEYIDSKKTIFKYQNENDTLIFFDEMQECVSTATSLKAFREDGRYDVICSGSLMGINYKEIESNSVGNKEDYIMHSMDF